jgi:hypothetical protein
LASRARNIEYQKPELMIAMVAHLDRQKPAKPIPMQLSGNSIRKIGA